MNGRLSGARRHLLSGVFCAIPFAAAAPLRVFPTILSGSSPFALLINGLKRVAKARRGSAPLSGAEGSPR